ncbi:LysR family transcriptional regulator [Actinopolyspora halophila]|uniref:LysR family transcriptional regulator n=1 Tax=Actinopolyspora halophila TaxID=1850 RepID=UPI000A06F6A0
MRVSTPALAQLSDFVAVVEEGHFGRAAQRSRMIQPSLSRQIQQLEKGTTGPAVLAGQPDGVAHPSRARVPAGRARAALRVETRPSRLVGWSSSQEGAVRVGFTAPSDGSHLSARPVGPGLHPVIGKTGRTPGACDQA